MMDAEIEPSIDAVHFQEGTFTPTLVQAGRGIVMAWGRQVAKHVWEAGGGAPVLLRCRDIDRQRESMGCAVSAGKVECSG